MSRWLFSMGAPLFGAFITIAATAAAAGCESEGGVGDPCQPELEYNPTFNDFDISRVEIEPNSFQCRSRLCLIHHFQGRVSCPYGQSAVGTTCPVPGTADEKVIGGSRDAGAEVRPQCLDRTAEKAVYCSCRCANADGRTDDGSNYCSCPVGFACEQLRPFDPKRGPKELSGAYCVKEGTPYGSTPCATTCDPQDHPCR